MIKHDVVNSCGTRHSFAMSAVRSTDSSGDNLGNGTGASATAPREFLVTVKRSFQAGQVALTTGPVEAKATRCR